MNSLEELLKKNQINAELIAFTESTHTAADAADALHCSVGQIIRTLLFKSDGKFFLAIITGDKKIDMQKLKSLIGGKRPELASPAEVNQNLGYSVGGVPCIMDVQYQIFIDNSINSYDAVYSGGGDSSTVMKIAPIDVIQFWHTNTVDIAKE